MARIKCFYYRYRCENGTVEHSGQICDHHNAFGNGFEYDECCDYADAKPYRTEDGMIAIPMQCRHVMREEVRFEKDVKSFDFDDDELVIPRRKIPTSRIVELSIDGERVIYKGERDD